MSSPESGIVLRGKGGSSGEARAPQESYNTLRSRGIYKVVDLLGEGPWHGFCTKFGVDCIDPTETVDVKLVDSKITFTDYPTGMLPVTSDSSGYPFNLDFPIYAYVTATRPVTFDASAQVVQGPGVDAIIRLDVLPRNQTEKDAMIAKFAGHPWAVDTTLLIDPRGKAFRLVIVNAGSGYITASVAIPPSTWQAIFYDDLPLASEIDLRLNHKDVRISYRHGDSEQSVMLGFESVSEILPDTRALISKRGGVYVFTIVGRTFDSLILNISLPGGLHKQNIINGDIISMIGTDSIKLKITQEVQPSTASVYSSPEPFGKGTFLISGKSMSAVELSFEGALSRANAVADSYSWRITIERLTLDDEDLSKINKAFRTVSTLGMASASAATDVKLSYPNCVLVGHEVNAAQFDSIPKRSYRTKMLKVQVPTNYYPPLSFRADGSFRNFAEYNRSVDSRGIAHEARDDQGKPILQSWDGSFYTSWTNNPAWVVYAICTQYRIGLAKYLPGVSDKWGLYSIGRECDRVVHNGYDNGATAKDEALYTCTCYIQKREEAFKVLADFCSIFRGYAYWRAGAIAVVQDRVKPIRMTITPTDVEFGLFNYTGTARKARHTIAVCQFSDPLFNDKLTPVVYEDVEGIIRYGVRTLSFDRFACTSRGEARRAAKAAVLDEQYNTNTVSFKMGIKGSILQPFDLVDIQDPTESGVPFQGRIVSVTINANGDGVLQTDRELPAALLATTAIGDYRLTCTRPIGELKPSDINTEEKIIEVSKRQMTDLLPIKAFSQDPNGRAILVISGPFPEGVSKAGVWALRTPHVYPQTMKILTIEESGKHVFSVVALQWSEALFGSIENDDPFHEDPVDVDQDSWRLSYPPRNLVLYVTSKYEANVLVHDLEVSWTKPEKGFSRSYEVWIAKGLANFQFSTSSTSNNVRIRIADADSYAIQVYSIGFNQKKSEPLSGSIVVGSISGTNQELISGLEIAGQANVNVFETPSVKIAWRLNWSSALDTLDQDLPPPLPPLVAAYLVQVVDPITGLSVYESDVTDLSFTLDLDRNKILTNGPLRDLVFRVSARLYDGSLSAKTSIRVSNTKPAAPVFTLTDDANGAVVVNVTSNRTPDFHSYVVWVDSTAGFTPVSSGAGSNLRYQGDSSIITLALTPGVIQYVRVAELDYLSKTPSDTLASVDQSIVTTIRSRTGILDYY